MIRSLLRKKRKNIESEYNGIAKGMARYLRVGEGNKQDGRIVEAVTTHNNILTPLSFTGKDHKKITDEKKGPKRRAVVSANEGPNVRVSNLTAKILNKAADKEESKSECKSTEGLLAKIEDLNKRLHDEAFDDENAKDERDVVAGSLDFDAWYKSFNPIEAGEIVRRRLEKGPSKTKVD